MVANWIAGTLCLGFLMVFFGVLAASGLALALIVGGGIILFVSLILVPVWLDHVDD